MSPEEARAVLRQAYQATGELPDWAIELALEIKAPVRRPWWRRWLKL